MIRREGTTEISFFHKIETSILANPSAPDPSVSSHPLSAHNIEQDRALSAGLADPEQQSLASRPAYPGNPFHEQAMAA
jgi:predicted Zn-dependent protease